MVDRVFQACVDLLVWLAAATGTTYKQINVIIFCIIWPLVTAGFVILCVLQRVQIRRLRRLAANADAAAGEAPVPDADPTSSVRHGVPDLHERL
jgi:hypothetical protein